MSGKFRLRASIALNVVLAITIAVLVLRKSEAPAPTGREVNAEKATDDASSITETPALTQQQPKLTRYADVASASGRRRLMVDQLRAAGFPNNVLARVVLSDLEAEWEKRFEEGGDGDSMAAMQLEHDMVQDAEMRAALGEEGFKKWDQERMLREANLGKAQLTASESDALYGLKKKLQQRQWELEQGRLKGTMDDAQVNDASDAAYAEFNQQMKTLLGDERYAKSQGVDEGTAAANLKQDLAKVNTSDSQFQDLLKAQQQWNERRSELDKRFQDDASSAAYAEQIKALDATRDQEYRRVLGTNAFDALQKEQDSRYAKIKKYQDNWDLDDSKVDYIYRSVRYYETAAEDYRSQARAMEARGEDVDWAAVNRNLQQFSEQTQQTLQNYLGQDRFNRMLRSGIFQFGQSPYRGAMQ